MRYFTLICLVCSPLFVGCDNGGSSGKQDSYEAPVLEAPPKEPDAEPTVSELMEKLGINAENRAKVSGGKIRELYLTQTNVKDLTPLKNLSALTILHLNGCPVADLSPLEGLRLEVLYAIQTKVKDLSPLEGMPLKELDLTLTEVEDLTPLEGMPLVELYLEGTGVTDLSPLKGMQLTQLNLFKTRVESLEALSGMPLKTLWIPETDVSSLEPLRGLSLVSLDIAESKVASLEPLAKMTTLERLNLREAPVIDLTPLKDLQLQRLVFTPGAIEKGLEIVQVMPTLRQLGTSMDTVMSATEFWAKFKDGTLE